MVLFAKLESENCGNCKLKAADKNCKRIVVKIFVKCVFLIGVSLFIVFDRRFAFFYCFRQLYSGALWCGVQKGGFGLL